MRDDSLRSLFAGEQDFWLDYAESTPGAAISMTPFRKSSTQLAPRVSYFSSRGPAMRAGGGDILKPVSIGHVRA